MNQTLRRRAEVVTSLARERGKTIVTAESCTAGSLVHLLAQCEGAGDALQGGFVAYMKANKVASLGVGEKFLAEHTAVSAAVARAMAAGALTRSPADVVAAITGVAGPDPDEDGNPVGLVYIAVGATGGEIQVERYTFGERPKSEICSAAVKAALTMLETLLLAATPGPTHG